MKKDEYMPMKPSYFDDDDFEYEAINDPDRLYNVPINRHVRIYCDGVYDLFHYGHARSLKQAKHLFPNVHLVVGVTDDSVTTKLKGNLVMNEKERAENLKHCRYVDEIITNAPWIITAEFLQEHAIDFVAHDDIPYKTGTNEDVYKIVKDMGLFVPIKRTKNISTTGIITSIVRNYDMYIRRNIERGASARDLNISYLQVKKIKMSKKVRELMKTINIQEELGDIRRELSIAMRYWEKLSGEIIDSFVESFYNKDAPKFMSKIAKLVKSKQSDG